MATKKIRRRPRRAGKAPSASGGELAVPAKIMRPQAARVFGRTRLFRELDRARARPIVWLRAPPGAGKTTLVITYLEARSLPALWYQIDGGDADPATFFHYLGLAAKRAAPRHRAPLPRLTPEYLGGLATFSRRYFEALGARLKAPAALVFDNYQEASPDSPLHAILREGLAALPKGVTAIFISRDDPPPALARLRANEELTVIEGAALALTAEEARGIARLRCPSLDRKSVERLSLLAGGWTAGLMLLLERESSQASALPLGSPAAAQAVFDYFAAEILERLEPETRRVLLEGALLPRMTARRLNQLTRSPEAASVLGELQRKNYFTVRHAHSEASYEYHPLFRAFLLAQARASYPRAELLALERRAAELLEADGEVGDAASLLLSAEDHAELARLVTRHAPALLGQGRGRTVEGWLRALPEELLRGSPWLLYWLGACRLPYDLAEARACFERAFSGFEAQADAAGLFLSWSAIVDTYVYQWSDFKELDHWIEKLAELLARFPEAPTPEVEAHLCGGAFLALMYRRPDHPELRRWEERVHRLVLRGDPAQQTRLGPHLLIYYTWWIGDLAKAETLVSTLRPLVGAASVSPLSRITWCVMAAGYYWMAAENATALTVANEGLALGEATGVHMWEFLLCSQAIFATLSDGDVAGAERYLHRMQQPTHGRAPTAMEKGMFHYLSAWANRLQGRRAAALEQARTAVLLAEEAGNRFTTAVIRNDFGRALFAQGEREEAYAAVRLSHREGVGMGARTIEYLTLLAEAEFALELEQEQGCLEALRGALAVGRAQGFQNHTWWEPPAMAVLYAKALEAGIEPEYVRGVLRKRRLPPPPASLASEAWPWPVRIHTLGRFAVERDSSAVSFAGTGGRKPMALLAALIAHGGQGVSQDLLAESLWPDAEGDAARGSFGVTLHRLRKLLGNEALILKDGSLSLDARHCWVDCQALEQALDRAEWASSVEQLDSFAARLLALYRGPFLPAFPDEGFAMAARERLRSKFLRQLAQLAKRWESVGDWRKAIEAHQRSIELEPLSEAGYRGLIRAQLAQGDQAEALATYTRCRNVLSSALGVGPSAETAALLKGVQLPGGPGRAGL